MKQDWKKNIAVFLTCQAISLFGSSVVQYAILWYITLETKSGTFATLYIICGFLPTFLLSPFAGVWADRYNRKFLIIASDGSIAICTLILAILFIKGYTSIWLLLAAASFRALGTAVQMPCVGAMIPDLVPEEQFTRINGINGTVQSFITLFSPMASGALLGMTTIGIIFFVDVTTAAVAISVMLAFLNLQQHPKTKEEGSYNYIGELKQGFSYIGSQKYLQNFFIFCAIYFVLIAPAAFLTPLQVARTFGEDIWRLTAIEVAFSIGMIIGGIVIASWGGLKNRIYTMAAAGMVMAICTIILGMPILFIPYLLSLFIYGLALPVFNTPAMVVLQEQVHPDYLGRVFGVMTMISSSMMPLGMLIFGPLADTIRIEWILICTGTAMLFATLGLFKNQPLVKAGLKT